MKPGNKLRALIATQLHETLLDNPSLPLRTLVQMAAPFACLDRVQRGDLQ